MFGFPENPEPGDLVVWHIPQVPGKSFVVQVKSVKEGKNLCEILAAYDAFQYEENIKPDYASANGLSEWTYAGDDDWDWFDAELNEEDE